MTRRRAVALGALALLTAGAVRVALQAPLAVSGPPPDDGLVRVPGVVHVHTTFSDGGGEPAEVARAAKATGLGFVAISDHNNLDARPFAGYHDGVLVMVGAEISTTAGHVLGLGLGEKPAFRFSGDARDAFDDIRHLGGRAFLAHPTNLRAEFLWTDWDAAGDWGIELHNGDSQWRAAGLLRLARTGLLYALNPRHALLGTVGEPEEALRRWDQALARRDVAGITGADAHSRVPVTRRSGVRFPSYEALFGLAHNVVLLDAPLAGDAVADGARIVGALATGRAYVALEALAPANGFFFDARSAGRRFSMGETVAPAPDLRFRAGGRVPEGTRLRLLKDGQPIVEQTEALDVAASAAGVYRVEARVDGWPAPWVISNPIYVFDAEVAAARLAAAAPAAADTVPESATVIEDFEREPRFRPEHDPRSAMDGPPTIDAAGPAATRAGRLPFRLAQVEDGADAWCSLVLREEQDWKGRQGFALWIKADGEYRFHVQVRDRNPASKDEGTEWWFASVRTSRGWQRVALPFSRFRSINPNSDGRLDLDRVVGVALVLDKGAIEPGTRGEILLDDLAVY
ncbi:MAG: CIA30 family protein [Vicinamibacteria bacterium]|nr:CIA30 family protein [Vicinamibacteria bacterium]